MISAATASWVAIALLLSAAAAQSFSGIPGATHAAVELALPMAVGLVILVIAIDAVAGRRGRGLDAASLVVYAATLGMSIECIVVAAGIGSATPAFLAASVIFVAIAVIGASPIRTIGAGPCLLVSALLGLGVGLVISAATGGVSAGTIALLVVAPVASVGLIVRYRRRAMPIGQTGSTASPGSRHGRGGVTAALALYLGVVEVLLDGVRAIDRFVGATREDPAWHARHGFPTDRRVHRR